MPNRFATSTKLNSENTNGKNRIPSVPAELRSMPATNSYIISATDCIRLGTRPRPLVEKMRNAEAAATVKPINNEELVKERSIPPTSIGENLMDLELMDRIVRHRSAFFACSLQALLQRVDLTWDHLCRRHPDRAWFLAR